MLKAEQVVEATQAQREAQFHINLSVGDVDCDHVFTVLYMNGVRVGRLTLSHGAYHVLATVLSNGAALSSVSVVCVHNDERYTKYLDAHRR